MQYAKENPVNPYRSYIALFFLFLATLGCKASTQKENNNPADATDNPSESQVEESQGEPFITGPNIAGIKLLTETQGVGEKPLLQWDSIANAGYYQLVVFDEAGKPYWAWEGSSTQIYLGGTDVQPPENSSGPVISNGYTWAVVAYSAEDQVIASSAVRTISP